MTVYSHDKPGSYPQVFDTLAVGGGQPARQMGRSDERNGQPALPLASGIIRRGDLRRVTVNDRPGGLSYSELFEDSGYLV